MEKQSSSVQFGYKDNDNDYRHLNFGGNLTCEAFHFSFGLSS